MVNEEDPLMSWSERPAATTRDLTQRLRFPASGVAEGVSGSGARGTSGACGGTGERGGHGGGGIRGTGGGGSDLPCA